MFSDTNVLNFLGYFIWGKFDITVTYLTSNFNFRFVESFFTMRRIFSSVTSGFATQYELNQVCIYHENCTKHVLNSCNHSVQRQPFRGVLLKKCSENNQQISRRKTMPKCDVNKVSKQLYWNRTSAWVFSCKFAAYFQNTFSQEHLWMVASICKD